MLGWLVYLLEFGAYPYFVHLVVLPQLKPRATFAATSPLVTLIQPPLVYLLLPAVFLFLLSPLFLIDASYTTNNFFTYFLVFEQFILVLHTFELLFVDADQQKDYLSSFLRFSAYLFIPAKITKMTKNLVGPDALTSTSSEALLDPSSEEARKLKKRQNIALEILSTEKAYVGYLKTFDKWFMKRLSLRETPLLAKDDVKTIFSNLETIIGVNAELLQELEGRINNWSPEQKIGDVFLTFVPFLKTYTIYSSNYSNALQTYLRCMKENKLFAQFIKDTAKYPECSFHDASDYLIMPIQRVPRYILLLRDLLKNTDESHVDYDDLSKALKMTQEVADYLNERLKVAENMQKVADIQRSFGHDAPTLVAPSRRFVNEAKLKYLHKNQVKDAQLFLLNELLVCGKFKPKKDHKYKLCIRNDNNNIDLLSIESVDDTTGQRADLPNGFRVLSKSKDSFYFGASSKNEQIWWIQAILDQKNNTQKVLARPDRRSLRQPELEGSVRRVKNPMSIRRHRKEIVAGLPVEVGVEEEPIDLASIRHRTLDLLARSDVKGLIHYVASILKVILRSDDDKDGFVFIFPRELAIKRAIRGATKLALAFIVRLVHVIITLTLSWALRYLPWFDNARFLLVHATVHFLAFSALLDFVMAGFGWAMVQGDEDAPSSSSASSVYYNIAEVFYDPYFATSLSDFWGRRYNAGLHDTLTTFIRSFLPSSPASSASLRPSSSSAASSPASAAEKAVVRRALTGLPLYLVVVGVLNFVVFFITERQLTFSVLLFFAIHAFLVLLQSLIAAADASPSTSAPSQNLLLFVGQQLRRARDVALPADHVRKWAGIGLFWLALYLTLPLYFADHHHDSHHHHHSGGAAGSPTTYFFNIWVTSTPTPSPSSKWHW